jgi:type VI secretion system protein ImpG
MIDGVVSLSSRPTTCRIGGPQTGGFCRGVAVELTLDEQSYRGVGGYLFASVLERFLAEYSTVNSFTRLTLATKQTGVVKTWPPRSGGVQLI